MKEKYYNVKDLYIVSVSKFRYDNYDCLERALFGYYIAQKKEKFLKADQFVLPSKNNAVIPRLYRREGFGVDEFMPLPLFAKNLPDKISHSQLIKLSEELNKWYQENKEEIIRSYEYDEDEEDDDEYGDSDEYGDDSYGDIYGGNGF